MVTRAHTPSLPSAATAATTATTTQSRDEIRMGTKINLALREDASAEDRLQAMFQVRGGDFMCWSVRRGWVLPGRRKLPAARLSHMVLLPSVLRSGWAWA